jgi:hypothetical protein
MLTSNPTISPANSIGAAKNMVVLMASKKKPVTNSGVMARFSIILLILNCYYLEV